MSTPAIVVAPLRLDEFFVETLNINVPFQPIQKVGERRGPIPEVEISSIRRVPNQLRFLVSLDIRLIWNQEADASAAHASVHLRVVGFFSFEPETDEHQAHHMISLNAPAILYGIARGIVAQTLALTTLQKVILPSVNFVEVMRQREANAKASESRGTPPSTGRRRVRAGSSTATRGNAGSAPGSPPESP